jgi:hypothetical protein
MVRRLGIVMMCLAFAPASSFLSGEAPHHSEASTLTAPWTDLTLPIEGATVTFSDAETVSVHHPKGDVTALMAPYGAALRAGGYTLDHDGSAGAIVSQTWSHGPDSLALTIQEQGGVRVVSLALLAF